MTVYQDGAMPLATSYTPKTGSLGNVNYKALNDSGTGYVTRTLSFTSTLADSSDKTELTVTYPAGTTLTKIISLFSVALGLPVGRIASLVAIVVSMFVTIADNTIQQALNIKLLGRVYLYRVTAKPVPLSSAGNQSYADVGSVYHGTIQEGNTLQTKTIYVDMYPEFISRKDTYVAQTFYREFWSSSASVVW